jgi:hypothetical protein
VASYRVDERTLAATPAAVDPALLEEAIAHDQSAAHAFARGELGAPPLSSAAQVARRADSGPSS